MVRVKVRFGFGFGSSSGFLLGTLHLPARRRAARRRAARRRAARRRAARRSLARRSLARRAARRAARRDRRCTRPAPLGLRLGLGPGRRAPSREALAGEGEGLG